MIQFISKWVGQIGGNKPGLTNQEPAGSGGEATTTAEGKSPFADVISSFLGIGGSEKLTPADSQVDGNDSGESVSSPSASAGKGGTQSLPAGTLGMNMNALEASPAGEGVNFVQGSETASQGDTGQTPATIMTHKEAGVEQGKGTGNRLIKPGTAPVPSSAALTGASPSAMQTQAGEAALSGAGIKTETGSGSQANGGQPGLAVPVEQSGQETAAEATGADRAASQNAAKVLGMKGAGKGNGKEHTMSKTIASSKGAAQQSGETKRGEDKTMVQQPAGAAPVEQTDQAAANQQKMLDAQSAGAGQQRGKSANPGFTVSSSSAGEGKQPGDQPWKEMLNVSEKDLKNGNESDNSKLNKNLSNPPTGFQSGRQETFKTIAAQYSLKNGYSSVDEGPGIVSELDAEGMPELKTGDELAMELKSGMEKDTGSRDEGNASFRLNGTAMIQFSRAEGRREFGVQLAKYLQGGVDRGGTAAESWKHHRFVLDDGKAINVAVRQADGALQMQLNIGNAELNKIIQQHLDEIRQHLQEQMNVEIDLQLQDFGGQQAGPEGEGRSDELGKAQYPGRILSPQATAGHQPGSRSVRYLGFNSNEWTA